MPRPSIVHPALVLIVLAACSGRSDRDTGAGGAGGTVNECPTFVGESAAGAARKIVWDLTVASSPPRCMTVKKGQDVAFEGDFTLHPLLASGGDTPSPFASVDD